jgi:hypothetical protein
VPVDEAVLDRMPEQRRQQGGAFLFRQADDVGGEALVYEQRLPPVGRMHPHDGVDDGRNPVLLLGRQTGPERVGLALLAVPGAVIMDRFQAIDPAAQIFRKSLVSAEHGGEQRVAALGRQFPRVQQRAQARFPQV